MKGWKSSPEAEAADSYPGPLCVAIPPTEPETGPTVVLVYLLPSLSSGTNAIANR